MRTVTAAILVYNDKILIARRKRELRNGGCWEFPGGKIKAGETPRQCLKRELKEEMGIEVKIAEQLGSETHDDGRGTIRLLFYRTDWISGDMRLQDHSEIRWVSERQLLKYDLTPADSQFAGEFKWSEL